MDKNDTIQKFCNGANFYMVRYDDSYGKILEKLSLEAFKDNEIHRSIKNKNGSMLFTYTILPKDQQYIMNPLQLILYSLDEAKAIEAVYPHIFNWVFDGLHLKAYAIIPSNSTKAHTTITRYGGTENFYKILTQHLNNIGKMKKGLSPDYNFTNSNFELPKTELSVGSINKNTDLYSIFIDINDNYKKILTSSKNFKNNPQNLNKLHMKYWAREINPDFIQEAKHMKLDKPLPYFDNIYLLYPEPIKRLINLKHKGNYNRYLISRFLLAVHSPKDAKFIYYSVLGDEERKHVKHGNCSTQWNYIRNNLEKYDCPTLKEVKNYIYPEDKPLSHLLEPIQDYIDKNKEVKEK